MQNLCSQDNPPFLDFVAFIERGINNPPFDVRLLYRCCTLKTGSQEYTYCANPGGNPFTTMQKKKAYLLSKLIDELQFVNNIIINNLS